MTALAVFEQVTGASGIAARIEALLPAGVRPRQLTVRTLLAGMCLAQADGRPAHLTRVHQALTSLPGTDQVRLGVITMWKHGPHQLTYRQAGRTFGLIAGALAKDEPDGLPSPALQTACDDLLEASIPEEFKNASTSLAVDWTDLESFSRPPPRGTSDCADPEASWGHRKNNLLRSENELSPAPYLLLRRHHGSTGERARRPRVRPPGHGIVVPARPGPRVRPRADRHARRRDPPRRRARRLRLRPPRPSRLGRPAPRRRRQPRPGPNGHMSSRPPRSTRASSSRSRSRWLPCQIHAYPGLSTRCLGAEGRDLEGMAGAG
jgi:hypothetical protein